MKKAIKITFGIACGGLVGFALGVIAAMALGLWSRWAHPDDPSAGSVTILVIATAPGGAIMGAVLGGLTIAHRPRLFLATFLPLAIAFIGLQATLSTLRRVDRPRRFALEVTGTPTAEYVGVISVDGDIKQLKGNIPAKYEFEAFQIELAFALVPSESERDIAVKTSADGSDLYTGRYQSPTGVHMQLKSFGYSEYFGGTSHSWSRMSPEEVDQLIKKHAIPPEFGKP